MKAEAQRAVTLSISVWFKEQGRKIPEGENILNLVFKDEHKLI